jgi:acyl-CoA reductase-like NAD-dependent aldehyde dehydrogenase
VTALLATIVVGDPAAATTAMGPLIGGRERDRVESMIRQAVVDGATLAYGGGRPAGLEWGYYVEPTLFTDVDRDFERAHAVARQIRSGMVNINASWGHQPRCPFGGYKQSGIGREEGAYGIAEFLEQKFISWPVGA